MWASRTLAIRQRSVWSFSEPAATRLNAVVCSRLHELPEALSGTTIALRDDQSLVGDFVYEGETNRAVAVHTAAMTEVLKKLYNAPALVSELLRQ
jgi:hypothetical protein